MNLRTQTSLSALILAGSLVWGIPVGFAQTDRDHTAHHPTPTPAGKDAGGMDMDMMGKGDKPAMMDGDMKQMMSMMRDMMGMMRMHGSEMPACGEDGVSALKTALKLTDAQVPLWTRFADALGSRAKAMNDMHEQMGKAAMPGTLTERLDHHEKMLTSHLESLKTMKEALAPLYASLSDAQKKIMDTAKIGPMGMM